MQSRGAAAGLCGAGEETGGTAGGSRINQLRFSLAVSRMDGIRNESIRGRQRVATIKPEKPGGDALDTNSAGTGTTLQKDAGVGTGGPEEQREDLWMR